MKQRAATAIFMAMVLLTAVQSASAETQEAQHEIVDARLEGYARNVTLNSGTSLVWLLLIFLGGVCVIGFFKDAKRSHLD